MRDGSRARRVSVIFTALTCVIVLVGTNSDATARARSSASTASFTALRVVERRLLHSSLAAIADHPALGLSLIHISEPTRPY